MVEYKKYDDLKDQQYFMDSVATTTSTVINNTQANENCSIARWYIYCALSYVIRLKSIHDFF